MASTSYDLVRQPVMDQPGPAKPPENRKARCGARGATHATKAPRTLRAHGASGADPAGQGCTGSGVLDALGRFQAPGFDGLQEFLVVLLVLVGVALAEAGDRLVEFF